MRYCFCFHTRILRCPKRIRVRVHVRSVDSRNNPLPHISTAMFNSALGQRYASEASLFDLQCDRPRLTIVLRHVPTQLKAKMPLDVVLKQSKSSTLQHLFKKKDASTCNSNFSLRRSSFRQESPYIILLCLFSLLQRSRPRVNIRKPNKELSFSSCFSLAR